MWAVSTAPIIRQVFGFLLVFVCIIDNIDKPGAQTIIYLMRRRFGIHRLSLTVQLVLSFVVLVLVTAIAVGLPAILLIRNQIQQQAWSQVDQGSRATQALYAGWESNVIHLATLTGHRPTLHSLLAQGNQEELSQYLQTLRSDTELDLLLVCDNNYQMVAVAGASVTSDICAVEESAGFYFFPGTTAQPVWLLAAYTIGSETASETGNQGKVIAGVALDDEFVIQAREQTGLEHTLFTDGQPVTSSLPAGISDRGSVADFSTAAQPTSIGNALALQIDGEPYYATRILIDDLSPVHGFELEDELALAVGDIAATQRHLVWVLSGSVIAIACGYIDRCALDIC